jgi:hypothetical protein
MNTVVQQKKPFTLYLLAAVLILQSVTALVCGAAMMADPSGVSMQLPGAVLERAPFTNFFVPGIFLFTCLGILPLFAVYELLAKSDTRLFRHSNLYHDYRFGWMLSLFCGFGTLIWITVQQFFTQWFHPLQTVYLAVGMAILIITLLPPTMDYCRVPRRVSAA